MAKPFTFTPIENATPEALAKIRKPGWHKRSLAAAKVFRPYTAACPRSPEADAKAREYAAWLARRDGLDVTGLAIIAVVWAACRAGMRPRAVTFTNRSDTRGVSVLLPHWSYEAPAVVEVHAAPWSAPVVVEVTGEARAAILGAMADADAARWVEAVEAGYPAPGVWAIDGTTSDDEPAPAPDLVRPSTVAPGGRMDDSGSPDPELVHPVEAIPAVTPVEAIDDGADWGPTPQSHPVVALCLSPAAFGHLCRRVLDGIAPAPGRTARGGAFMVSTADAMALQDIASIRWVGLPRRRYTARHMPALPPVRVSEFHVLHPGAGRVPAAVTFHAAP